MKRGDIYMVSLNPAQGREQQGHRPVLVVSPAAFNSATKLPVVLPITNGGDFARRIGFAVEIAGIKTTGLIRCDQPRVLDLAERGGLGVPRLVRPLAVVLALAVLGQVSDTSLTRDVAFRMVDFARRNAERAGVRQYIEFKTADALQRPVPCERGVLMFNPPYGERIDTKGSVRNAYRARSESESDDDMPASNVRAGREQFQDEEAATFFQRLSSHWKKQYTGWNAWILSPDMKLPSAMRLKESRRVVMFNGPIECRLFRFDLVAGGNRRNAAASTDAPAEPGQTDAS